MNRSNCSNGMYVTYCDKPVKTQPKAFVERSKAGVYNLPNDEVVDYLSCRPAPSAFSYSLNVGYVLSKSKNSKYWTNKKTIVLVIVILVMVIVLGVLFAHILSPRLKSTFYNQFFRYLLMLIFRNS